MIEASTAPRLTPPSVGDFVLRIRTAAGHTQTDAAKRMQWSATGVSHVERGERPATAEFCDAFTKAYTLTDAELLHLANMTRGETEKGRWDAAVTPATPEAVTPEMRASLHAMTPHAAAWVDDRWRVLADNQAYRDAYPGLDGSKTVLHWFVQHPLSRGVMLDWDSEFRLTVAWLRALMGTAGNPTWAVEVLDDLASEPEFVEAWEQGQVAFGRLDPHMHLWDLRRHEPYTLYVQLTRAGAHLPPMQHFLGTRTEYQGGLGLLKAAGHA